MKYQTIPFWSTTALAAFVVTIGCSKNEAGRLQVYPASGKVTIKGQPVEGARVALFGSAPELTGPGTVVPVGTTDANGAFQLRSYEPEDGAPAGEFKVTVIWPEPIPPNVDQEMYKPKDRLGGRYSNPQKSGLTATVPEGCGELPPFELQ
jgi:hypothetical protein